MIKIDAKTIIIIALVLAVVGGGGFSGWLNKKQSSEIQKLSGLNRALVARDSIRNVQIKAFHLSRDTIHLERDTIIIYMFKTDEQTKENIARLDTANSNELLRYLSNRYGESLD